MKTIVIIPARGGSKRLTNKNNLLLGGIPLLAHSILYAQNNLKFIDAIYVTTNDEAVKKTAIHYGVKVIDRPESLSGDHEPTVSALKHALATIEHKVENVILLQPTNPLRTENLLEDAFTTFESKQCDSLFTVTRNQDKLGKIIDEKFVPFNYEIGQRSQDLAPLFYENGLLYITKAALIAKGIIISENAFPLEVNHIFANVDIDTLEDLEYAEYLIKKVSRLRST
ncbi:N-acylneuraminate cytidylyltransferase [Flavobacterium sp. 28A]|uniref:acylneuraminate cytidylyltransferase family protein n=1 Tax=Flavobacterium sp. 28A TaxID=2735895 RepID=UPI0015708E0A|nr:acylneuraminate cytidylyltransferase family protein [Flavobacterium sp. 28A]NRT15141.1 N-acylneuraminate cytidylyltransferase [Flavobacterium sp. 28A]